jgi:hypothetical protein
VKPTLEAVKKDSGIHLDEHIEKVVNVLIQGIIFQHSFA